MIEKYLQLSHELDKKQCLERVEFEIEFSFFKLKELEVDLDNLIKEASCNWVLSSIEYKEIINKALIDINNNNNINAKIEDNKIVMG